MSDWFGKHRITLFVLGVLALVFALSAWRSYELNGGYSVEWESGFWQNFSTEVLGAMATFVLFELILNRDAEKKSLLLQLRSSDNATALNALEQIKAKGWDKDGTLVGKSLYLANFEGAYLQWANLGGTNLSGALLKNSYLQETNFEEAYFVKGDLQGANLQGTNLTRATLKQANLKDAKLSNAILSTETTLPDGKAWTPETDMRRYTDPNHPEFWQPDWVKNQQE